MTAAVIFGARLRPVRGARPLPSALPLEAIAVGVLSLAAAVLWLVLVPLELLTLLA